MPYKDPAIRKAAWKSWRAQHPEKAAEYWRNYSRANPEKVRARKKERRLKNPNEDSNAYLNRTYGISLDDYNRILKDQGNSCGICCKPIHSRTDGHVDHDHAKKIGDPGYVRGILCSKCNVAGGMFRDDAELMRRAISWFCNFKPRYLSVSDMKLEQWKSNQNHEERHFFLPSDETGYQSCRYIFGYNPQVISEDQLKKIFEIIDQTPILPKLSLDKFD